MIIPIVLLRYAIMEVLPVLNVQMRDGVEESPKVARGKWYTSAKSVLGKDVRSEIASRTEQDRGE